MKASDLEKKLGKKKHKTIGELKEVIATRADQAPNFCLFLGSGASRSSGIRTAGEMVDEWRAKIFAALHGGEAPAAQIRKWLTENAADWYDENREYATLIERVYPLPTNRRKFIETEISDKTPSIGYAYLVRIAEAGLIKTIFTTNFDDLLNDAFYHFSSTRALVCAHDSSIHSISIASRRTKIVKLHGDYLFDNLKNTAQETCNLTENMKEKLGEFLKEYGLIVSGFSGADDSITRILMDMADDNRYLRNGLYWCFRAQDEVTQESVKILERSNSFFVLTPGFDELMADIYCILNSDATPFNSKLASDRASSIIESYLQSQHLKSSPSKTIQKHLETLEEDKNASLLSDLMRDLNTGRITSTGLTDKNLLVYLEIERALKDRNPELALTRLSEELSKSVDSSFKGILLRRRFLCSVRLNRFHDAKECVKQILQLDPANYYMALNEASLIEQRADRVAYLESLKESHPYSPEVLNCYAQELTEALDKHDKVRTGLRSGDVLSALSRSVEVDPSLENDAWSLLFRFHAEQPATAQSRESLTEIVDKHLKQNAYSAKTMDILFRYCKKYKTTEYKGDSLFNHLKRAYERHYPRDFAAHLDVFVSACIEFKMHRLLRPLLEEARNKEELVESPEFAVLMMDVCYDVFRDVPAAIAHGQDYLKRGKNTAIEVKLVDLYLNSTDPHRASEIHTQLRGAMDYGKWLRLEAKIFEHEGRFQDAVDAIESIPDRRDFKDKYTSVLSYLELKMGMPAKARKRCREFLDERAFSVHCEAEIINYEYAKKLDSGNIDKKRLDSVAKATTSEMVKAVCYSLLEKDSEALTIVREESEKRFSAIDDCLPWPVMSKHRDVLMSIREELLKAKRSLATLPTT